MTDQLTYEEWIQYCFDREVSDPEWYWNYDDNGEADWYQPEPSVLASYLCQLFENSRKLIEKYTPEQVAQGLYFICSNGSSYFQTAREPSVTKEAQIAWVKSICSLYTDLFARECSRFYSHLDRGPEAPKPLNGLCYMFWDLDCLEGAAMFPGAEHLVEPIFEVLFCALKQANLACVESALHGLGHLEMYHPERTHRLIEGALKSRTDFPVELETYAKNALEGYVQ